MLQIGNNPIDTMYVGGKLVQQVYMGIKKVYPENGVIPKAIKDSMVLWYDIKRQGATNESMAENPVLRDLSGNGHDATCYNFAWTEESGISTTNYPNALVSDGVDDYCLVEGLPLLDKERGYTVIAKRKHLGSILTCLASRRNSVLYDGAFVFEFKPTVAIYRCDSFNSQNRISAFEESDITCQTSQRYNDTAIGIGDASDNGVLNLFVLYNSYFGEIALYSFLLFNRDLTEQEIAWVKTNLIEGNNDDADWYGVEFYTTLDNPDCIRIGNPNLHRTLPVHSQMRGCLLNDDGEVTK